MPQPLKLVFMGTPGFAVPVLDALVRAEHAIACVYTRPPRRAGRGHKVRPSAVQGFAESLGLAVRTPENLGDAAEQRSFAARRADAAVVAAYGLILPQPVLSAPRLGCINVHASLLPRWRGAAPIERAIMAGDGETGISVMAMDEGLDSGPILAARALPIGPQTTAPDLRDALARLGAALVVEVLEGLAAGALTPAAQASEGVTYARRIEPAECRLDWRHPAAQLERAVRALTPRPGAWFEHGGERIKVLRARPAETPAARVAAPGTVLDGRPAVACGEGVLQLLRLQRPGRAPMDADAFLRGYALPAGTRLP